MEFVKELLEEQQELLKDELRFADGVEYSETKKSYEDTCTSFVLFKMWVQEQ